MEPPFGQGFQELHFTWSIFKFMIKVSLIQCNACSESNDGRSRKVNVRDNIAWLQLPDRKQYFTYCSWNVVYGILRLTEFYWFGNIYSTSEYVPIYLDTLEQFKADFKYCMKYYVIPATRKERI